MSCRSGIERSGTVHYSDQLQVLVKWDDGASSSLPMRLARLRLLTIADELAAREARGNPVGLR